MPEAESQGVSIYYESNGSGPAVVFAHGAGGNHTSWWQQVPEFARRHTVVTFDHRGFGRSRCSAEQFDPRLFGEDLLAILDACEIERAALVCQSMGGWTGLPAATRWPARVRCLVLCGTPGGLITQKVLDAQRAIGQRVRGERVLSGSALAPDFPSREPARAFLYDQISGQNPGLEPQAIGRLFQTRVEPEQLEGYGVPTLMVAGEHDALFPPEVLRDVAERIPGARVYDFAGVGHSSYFEDPAQFNRVVGEFIDEHP